MTPLLLLATKKWTLSELFVDLQVNMVNIVAGSILSEALFGHYGLESAASVIISSAHSNSVTCKHAFIGYTAT